MPDFDNVHYDVLLANAAVEYKNDKFIANDLVPAFTVPFASGKYTAFDKKDRFTRVKTLRGPKGEANTVDWNTTEQPYACDDHALKDFISSKMERNNNKILNLRTKVTERVTDLLLLEREILTAEQAFTYANFGTAFRTTLSGSAQLSEYTTSDPLAQIDAAKAACFADPNVIVMGKQVYDVLKRHPQLLDHVKGGSTNADPAKVTLENMAEVFEVDRIIVGAAKYNTANKGQTASFDYIWGKHILCAYVDPKAGLDGITWAKTFGEDFQGGAQNMRVRPYWDDKTGGGGTWIEVELSMAISVVCSDLAYLIKDAVA